MKLNNKGWGLTYLIVAGCVILLILIITSIRINSFIKENKKNHKADNSDSSEVRDYDYSSFYITLEETLVKAGRSYSSYHETLINNTEVYTLVTYDTLKEEGFISSLSDPAGNGSCDGYVLIYNDYTVKGFIECEKYKTEDYDKWVE